MNLLQELTRSNLLTLRFSVNTLSLSSYDLLVVRFKNGLHLIQIMEKKIAKKYAELMHKAQQATGRKKAI